MSRRRTIEYSPHYNPEPERPPRFGEPLPKRSRRPLSGKGKPAIPQDLGLVPKEDSQGEASTASVEKRGWETYVLDKGTGTQETIEGRSYTIGINHPLVDVYIFPPDKPDGVRIGTVGRCRIVAIKTEESRKKDGSSGQLNRGWVDAIVLKGVSRRKIEEPMQFDNGFGKSMIVHAQWKDIRRGR